MYSLPAGMAVATQSDPNTFYYLTDHNRAPISQGYEPIEKVSRMANGTMRKFVVANKKKFATSWKELPSATSNIEGTQLAMPYTVDGYQGGAWMKAFYEQNVFKPIYLKVFYSREDLTASSFYPTSSSSGFQLFEVFITEFSYDVAKRLRNTDYVDINIGFTEI